MKLRMLMLIATLCFGSAFVRAQTTDAPMTARVIEPQGELTYPISARIEMPEANAAVNAPVRVKIRNTVTEAGRHGVAMTLMAVVLRGVQWTGQPDNVSTAGQKKWLAPIYGSTKKNANGTVAHNTMAQRLTELAFESGLLLPGEELTVELPSPLWHTASLSITYAIVPGNFESQVLLAEPISPKGPGKLTVEYQPYSADTARARERVRGVALVKATMDPRAPKLAEHEQKLEFELMPDSAL